MKIVLHENKKGEHGKDNEHESWRNEVSATIRFLATLFSVLRLLIDKTLLFSINVKSIFVGFLLLESCIYDRQLMSKSIFSLNLYELIKKNNYQGFSLSLIRRFCNSIVKCLRLLYHENIIHCDLKPVSWVTFFVHFWSFCVNMTTTWKKSSSTPQKSFNLQPFFFSFTGECFVEAARQQFHQSHRFR